MASLLSLLSVAILIGLILAGAELVRKRGSPDTAGQRLFLFFTWTALGFLTFLGLRWIFPRPSTGFLIYFIPPTPGLMAMALLLSREWRNLPDGQKKAILLAVGLLAVLIGTPFLAGNARDDWSQLETVLPLLVFLFIPLFLFIVWKWGNRYPVMFGILAVLYLAGFNVLEMGSLFLPSNPAPGTLPESIVIALAYLMIPGFVITTTAILVLHSLKPATKPDESKWVSGKVRLASWVLILALLASIVYTFVWLWIWDGVEDGVRFILLLGATTLTVVSIALVIAMTSSGWQRWAGLPFAALVLALLYGGVILIGNRVSNDAVTEGRARRIREAIENYHEKSGWYPFHLNELTPGEMWRIPLPMVIRDQDWCYEGGSDYYRLGLVYREHWSSPYLSVRVYASAGNFPKETWICDQKLAELRAEYQTKFNSAPKPASLPESSLSLPRTRVEPILSGNSFSIGDWSPDGRYLVFGQAVYFWNEEEQVTIDLYFLEAGNGSLCQPPESRWTVRKSNGLSEHYAWLPDGRFLYLTDAGELWAFQPCSGEVEDLTNRFSTRFTNIVSFQASSGQVLLEDQDALWLLNGSSLETREIAGIPLETHWAWYAWTQEGTRLAASFLTGPEEGEDAYLFIINVESGKVEKEMALQNVSDANLPVVEWLTKDELLLHGQSLTVMDLRFDPPLSTDLIRDIFLLDIDYPDISSVDTRPDPTGEEYTVGLRANHPHNRAIYLYDSKEWQVQVFEHNTHSLFFFPEGGWIHLPKWEDEPSYTDEYEMVWMGREGIEQRLVVEGHVPRSHPQMFPKYLPGSSRLVFNSSQGVSLVSIPAGETLRFWELSGGTDFYAVFPSPHEDALVLAADGDGIYYIPLLSK